jgi:hypothetical protein
MNAVLDPVALNLATVEAHVQGEARDPASVLGLYTEDAVLEVPSRGLRFDSHAAIEANYRAMFGSMAEVEITPGERFATPHRVVDDCTVRFLITGDGLTNAPFGIGTRVILRLLHVFEMRGGRIARESVFEGWSHAD